jgi:hypothetical protein
VIDVYSVVNALSYISANAINNDNYYIVAGSNETLAPQTLSFTGKTVSVTLIGTDAEQQINLSGTGALFTVSGSSGNEVTLVLDNNISLKGVASNTSALVVVNSYGKLIMKNGSKIWGNHNSSSSVYGGGGRVYGTLTMLGGTISGNSSSYSSGYGGGGVYVESTGIFTMSGGTISENSACASGGVAVYGTFTMSGGVISGNSAFDSRGGGVFVWYDGTFTKTNTGGIIYGINASMELRNTSGYNIGDAVYSASPSRSRNTTVQANEALSTSSSAGWE